jgi:hypothetical protein
VTPSVFQTTDVSGFTLPTIPSIGFSCVVKLNERDDIKKADPKNGSASEDYESGTAGTETSGRPFQIVGLQS